jgi:hypothetical protein
VLSVSFPSVRKRINAFQSILILTVVMRFECGTRILRVIHGRDAPATLSNCTTTNLNLTMFLPTSTRKMYKSRLPRQFIILFGRGALLSEQTHLVFAETFDPCGVGDCIITWQSSA